MIRSLVCVGLILSAWVCNAADAGWMKHVSETDRARTNPYAKQADAIAAGSRLFQDHCAKCHGEDALGRGKKPSLRTRRCNSVGELLLLASVNCSLICSSIKGISYISSSVVT